MIVEEEQQGSKRAGYGDYLIVNLSEKLTNALEGLHRQLRKVTKNRSLFPNDEALSKILFLAIRDVTKKWTSPVRNWALTISEFAVMFADRLDVVKCKMNLSFTQINLQSHEL